MNRDDYFRTDWARINAPRTRFRKDFDVNTTFNTGVIVPLHWDEVLPGDSLQRAISYLMRLTTPIAPFMNRVYLDVYCFFVPNRIVWTHWNEFYGENNTTAWTQTYQYVVPQAEIPSSDIETGSIGDYMGLPIDNTFKYYVTDLPLRGYLMIYNEWFRDENIIDPVLFSKGDTPSSSVDYSSYPLVAAKLHDYFTSLLPDTQKGDASEILNYGPVVVGNNHLNNLYAGDLYGETAPSGAQYGMRWANYQSGEAISGSDPRPIVASTGGWNMASSSDSSLSTSVFAVPANLWAQMNITIESIRNAAVIQHVYERLAASGSRYVEALRGLWGVTPADASLQIPEYLGGKRFQLSVSDVVSTADTVNSGQTAGEFLGQVGAYSKNKDGAWLVNKSFTEHGEVHTVIVVRVEQQYYQGLERKWTRKDFFDFYLPQLNNIGNQPVYKREINLEAADGTNGAWDEILGYSEAWADYRYTPSRCSGLLRPNASNALTYYNASDTISNTVSLSQDFIQQGAMGINQVLAVTSATNQVRQWIGQFHFHDLWTRRMDAHSIPGIKRI